MSGPWARPPPALRRHRRRRDERPGARRQGARRDGHGLGPAAGSPYAEPLRAAGIVPAVGHDAANVPGRGARSSSRRAIPPTNPERAAARDRGCASCTAADLLGELTAPEADHRGHRHARQDDDVGWSRTRWRRCGVDPATSSAASCARPGATPPGATGEWLVVEADESDRSLLELAPTIAVLTNVELDHHTTYGSRRDVDDTFRAFLAPRPRASSGTGPSCCALAGAGRGRLRRAGAGARPGRLALRARRRAGPPGGPRRAQRAQRGRGADGLPPRRRRPARGRRGARELRRRRPPLRAARHDPGGRAGRRRLRPPSDRGARDDRGGPHARAAAGRRGLPAASLLPHGARGARLRRGAGPGRRRARPRRLPGARARARTSPG